MEEEDISAYIPQDTKAVAVNLRMRCTAANTASWIGYEDDAINIIYSQVANVYFTNTIIIPIVDFSQNIDYKIPNTYNVCDITIIGYWVS